MKPFNLKDALAGKPVVTRDGIPVTQLHLFEDVSTEISLYGVIDGGLMGFTKEGKNYNSRGTFNTLNDLFMASVKVEKWVNIYRNGMIFSGQMLYDSRQEAKDSIGNKSQYFDTVRIVIDD